MGAHVAACKRIGNRGGIGYVTSNMGNLALSRGDICEAMNKYRSALQIGITLEGERSIDLFLCVLSAVATLLRQIDEKEQAVELATLVLVHPDNPTFLKIKTQKLLTNLQQEIAQDEFNVAQERGRKRDLITTAEEMLIFLEKGEFEDKILRGD